MSMDLVSSRVAKKEIRDLKTAVLTSRFEQVFQEFSQISKIPASYMAKEGVISVVVVDILMPNCADH